MIVCACIYIRLFCGKPTTVDVCRHRAARLCVAELHNLNLACGAQLQFKGDV